MAQADSTAPEQSNPTAPAVQVVREWTPSRADGLQDIRQAVDSIGHNGGSRRVEPAGDSTPARPVLDVAALHAKVDRLTKNVKARKLTITEVITEYEDASPPSRARTTGEPWDAEGLATRRPTKARKASPRRKASRKKR